MLVDRQAGRRAGRKASMQDVWLTDRQADMLVDRHAHKAGRHKGGQVRNQTKV